MTNTHSYRKSEEMNGNNSKSELRQQARKGRAQKLGRKETEVDKVLSVSQTSQNL